MRLVRRVFLRLRQLCTTRQVCVLSTACQAMSAAAQVHARSAHVSQTVRARTYIGMYASVPRVSACQMCAEAAQSKTLRQDAQRSDSAPVGSFRRVVHGPTVSCAEAVTTATGCVQPVRNVTRWHPGHHDCMRIYNCDESMHTSCNMLARTKLHCSASWQRPRVSVNDSVDIDLSWTYPTSCRHSGNISESQVARKNEVITHL